VRSAVAAVRLSTSLTVAQSPSARRLLAWTLRS